jgi:hypothetical protein
VIGGPKDFVDDIRIAAQQLDVGPRVTFAATDLDLGVSS